MRHAGFPNLTRACRSARWPGRLDWWFPAARRVVRVEAAVPPRGSSEAVEVAEHERSLELLQLERRSGETQTETISIAVSSMGAGLHDVAEARDADFLIVVGGAHRSGVGRVLAGDDERSVLHHAPCAVAVAPAGYADGSRPVGTIAAACDGSVSAAPSSM